MSSRAHQAVLLMGPAVRMLPWVPIGVASVLSLLAMLPAMMHASAPAAPVWGLRVSAVLLGAGASFAMIDPLRVAAVTPTPRWLRQWIRTGSVLVPAVIVWLVLFTVADTPAAVLPGRDLAVEAAVCGLIGLVGAALAARSTDASNVTGLTGPASQAALIVGSMFLRGRGSPWPLPPAPTWPLVHRWWSLALLILVLALIAANGET